MSGQGTLHGIMKVRGKHDIIFDVILSESSELAQVALIQNRFAVI